MDQLVVSTALFFNSISIEKACSDLCFSVYMKHDACHYPGSLRLVNFPLPDSPSAISVGGLLFYKTSGPMLYVGSIEYDICIDADLL